MNKPAAPDTQPERARNPLGRIGLIWAGVSFVLFLGTIGLVEWVSWNERQSWERQGIPTAPGSPWTGKSAPLAQAFLFIAGTCTGGIASLLGLGLSIGGLRHHPRLLASWGLAVSLLSLALVLGWYLVRHAETRLG